MNYIELPDEARLRHLYIAGLSGYGKSSLIRAMAAQDIQRGKGVTVLDPKGDLVETLLHWIPGGRIKDTFYLSAETPIPIDVLSYAGPQDRPMLAQDLIALFKRFMELGERMEPVLKWTVQTLLEAGGCCFFDVYSFLADVNGARDKILKRITNPDILHYWNVEFQKPYYRGAEVPILSRLTDFKLIPSLQDVLGNSRAELAVQSVVDSGKVLLVNLGSFGGDASALLGILLTAQIQQAIFRRGAMLESQRVPYYLYADEFQDFKNFSFNTIMRQARGFGLGLTLANLHPKQIPDLIDDVKGCVTSYVLFKMDAEHARILASKIRPQNPEELESLTEFRALYHAADGSSNFINTPRPSPSPSPSHAASVKERMKAHIEDVRLRTLAAYSSENEDQPHTGGSGKPEPKTIPPDK